MIESIFPVWIDKTALKMRFPGIGEITLIGNETTMPMDLVSQPFLSFIKKQVPKPIGYTWWNEKNNFCYVDSNGIAREIPSTGTLPF